MVHGKPKTLISLNPKRISTPWVAGSNPAGIANDFSQMEVGSQEVREPFRSEDPANFQPLRFSTDCSVDDAWCHIAHSPIVMIVDGRRSAVRRHRRRFWMSSAP
jgi:hypothetical protein